MGGYKSALKWYYREHDVIFPNKATDEAVDDFIQGYKKDIAEKKHKGIMSVWEGRSPMSFTGYCFISMILLTITPVAKRFSFMESVFAWCFEVLSWNLLIRANNVASIMLQYMHWWNDCLVFKVEAHKGDPKGEGISKLKHVYANPLKPQICPILAMAVFVSPPGWGKV
mmetsp:Transcript_23890/g.31230  ORF Transcript_23890/g.31230 Transcript_23890/m.31230 type:complete len:169 (-) Transcript_23890:234-740(-)